MKIEAWNEVDNDAPEEITLRLVRDELFEDGRMDLTLVDSDGQALSDGCILSILPEGTAMLYTDLDSDLGLQLDDDGRIITEYMIGLHSL